MNIKSRYVIAIILLLVVTFFIAAYSHSTKRQIPTAGLSEVSGEEQKKWKLPQSLIQAKGGNFYRVVKGTGIRTASALELAASGDGKIEYFQNVPAGRDMEIKFNMQFLSTQGTGQYSIAALDNTGKVLGLVGWIITGEIPADTANSKWNNIRSAFNYKGEWLSGVYNLQEVMARSLPAVQLVNVDKYRVSVTVAKGQHMLLAELSQERNLAKALKLTPELITYSAVLGQTISIKMEVENITKQELNNISLKICEPYAYGIISSSKKQQVDKLLPGEKKSITWQLKAQRADGVNADKPWRVNFTANDILLAGEATISVTDNRAGKIFYVMTDDLEAIDGAGYQKAWGNCNGWLDPQEIKIQMVNKAEKLNSIAGKYGARWTHYIAWPIIRAVEWAGGISGKPDWQQAAEAVKLSVTEQAKQGHEYGVHMHSDYDPLLPGNLLSYNSQINGLWANHLRHGWAHSVAEEGSFEQYASRAGILYSYQCILDNLQKDSLNGQIITSRAGSFDFGVGQEDQAASIQAYKKVGLWGGSDADGNIEGLTAGDFGREIYFTGLDSINTPMTDITNPGIVEFRPTARDWINYDSQTTAELNSKTERGVNYFTQNGTVKAGIHGIIGFTHAMFVMGSGNWQATEGGQFQAIEEHLRFVKDNYVAKKIVIFATASEMVKAYIDYYAPQPVAVYGPVVKKNYFTDECKIQILGQDIPFDKTHIQKISIKYPLYFRDTTFKISVLKNGQPIYSTWGLPTPTNDIEFAADDINAEYTLQIFHNPTLYSLSTKARRIKQALYENIANLFTKSAMN